MMAPFKSLVVVGTVLLAFAGLLFYAEHNRRVSQAEESLEAVQEVLKAQNQAFLGRISEGLSRAERDALAALERWKKRAKISSFLSDTALSEPDAPQWIVVAGRRVRAAGVVDDALLEDALVAHLSSLERLSFYQSRGKHFLFIRGTVEGHSFAAAYSPEAFFSSFRSVDGIRAWIVLRDGTVVYHPLSRFIGSSAANLKPVAAGIAELTANRANPITHFYLGLEGREALGAWTPLPSFGLLVGSEWPKAPRESVHSSGFFWLGILVALVGSCLVGLGWRTRQTASARAFDESRLDEDAMDYLEGVRSTAERAIAEAVSRERSAREALYAKEENWSAQGNLHWRLSVLEEFQDKILPQVTGKQVWSQLADLFSRRAPGISLIFYRYSPSSFSLVPETVHGLLELPETAITFFIDSRIFLGSPSYLQNMLQTEAFQKWDTKRRRLMPLHQTEFRVYPIQCAGVTGAILAYFDERMNRDGELAPALNLLDSLVNRTATFCDSLSRLLQSMNAKGYVRPTMAGSSNSARNQPRPS